MQADDGYVVAGVKGAFFAVDDVEEFVAHVLDIEIAEVVEFLSEAKRLVGSGVNESNFDTVAVEQQFVAEVQLNDFGGVGLFGEDAEQGAADVDFGVLAGFVDEHGGGMSGAGQAESEGASVEQSVAASGELEVAQVLSDHVSVELFEGFAGLDECVAVAFDAFGYDGAFDEHGEQCGRHAVSDGVGDVEADVVFVEAHDVVNVTADPGGGSEDVGEFYAGDFGHFTGQEIALESGGELHFFVDLGEVVVKGLADHA